MIAESAYGAGEHPLLVPGEGNGPEWEESGQRGAEESRLPVLGWSRIWGPVPSIRHGPRSGRVEESTSHKVGAVKCGSGTVVGGIGNGDGGKGVLEWNKRVWEMV